MRECSHGYKEVCHKCNQQFKDDDPMMLVQDRIIETRRRILRLEKHVRPR